MNRRVEMWTRIVKVTLLLLSPVLIPVIIFFMMEWCKYCQLNFPDISEEQVFECKPGISSIYLAEINLKGEVSDSIHVSIYYHTDLKHRGIHGTTFVQSHTLIGVLDTTMTFPWSSTAKLFGVIQPSSNAKGHLKGSCYFVTEFM